MTTCRSNRDLSFVVVEEEDAAEQARKLVAQTQLSFEEARIRESKGAGAGGIADFMAGRRQEKLERDQTGSAGDWRQLA